MDWDDALYTLTGEEDTDPAGSVYYALYVMKHVSTQLHDGMLSYEVPADVDPSCVNPFSLFSVPDMLLKNLDAGRIKALLLNGEQTAGG